MIPNQLKEKRKELFDKMEMYWKESNTPEDDLFYYHSSEDRIVLSHALFGVMTKGYDRSARRLAAVSIVPGGYGGDMQESQFEELLDDMDFYHNRVKCSKIEQLVPTLNKLVEEELQVMPWL